jgi:phage shock protein A
MDSKLEMDALEAVIRGGTQLAAEALERKADVKQGRLASEAMGRVNGATKIRLEYRLNQLRLAEIEAKLVEAPPAAVAGQPEQKAIEDQKAAA